MTLKPAREAGPPGGPQPARVVAEHPQPDAVQVDPGEGVVQHEPRGLGAVPLAPAVLLPEHEGQLGETAAENLFRDELFPQGQPATVKEWFQGLADNLLADNDPVFKTPVEAIKASGESQPQARLVTTVPDSTTS